MAIQQFELARWDDLAVTCGIPRWRCHTIVVIMIGCFQIDKAYF
jgi:hypothetical protein